MTTDSDPAGTRPIQPAWTHAELADLLQDFGDQVEITIEFPEGVAVFRAYLRPRPSLRRPADDQRPPVAVAGTLAGLRITLLNAGYEPWA